MIENGDATTTVRYDTSTNWSNANPVLAKGEIGVESDKNLIKIGDGINNWNGLIYSGLFRNPTIAKGTPTDVSNWNMHYFYYDKNNVRLGGIENGYNSGNVNRINMIAYKANTTDNSTNVQIGVGFNGDNWFTYAPTPATADNSTNIATTAWSRLNFLPLSGGTVTGNITLTGKSIASSSSGSSSIQMYGNDNGGTTGTTGSNINIKSWYGVGFINGLSSASTYNKVTVGIDCRNGVVRATTTSIASSDERLKANIKNVPNDVLDAWGEVEFKQYNFISAIQDKGEKNARLHNGMIAQEIERVFKKHGLDAMRYGLFCYDKWDKTETKYDEQGNVLQEGQEAGESYALRYEECLCMEASYQRRRADRLEERIAKLESLLTKG